jgi:predicted transcriptional regulator
VGPAVTVSLENNGTVSVEGFSRNANVSLTEAKKWLERLYKAGLVDK